MKPNIKAAVAPAQQYADQLSQNAQINSFLKGAGEGIQASRKWTLQSQQARALDDALKLQIKDYEWAMGKAKTPEEQLQYAELMSRLDILRSQLNSNTVDEVFKAYQKSFSPAIEDPRKLANDLKLAHITGQYKVDAAKQGGNALRFLFGGLGDLGDIEGSLPFSQNSQPSSVLTPQGAQDPIDRGLNLAKQQMIRLQGG